MTSNQDILAFLKAEKEAREREKLEEAEIRAKEREQDMSKMAEMIRLGVRDEVKAAVHPVEERLAVQEETSQDLGVQMKNLVKELENLKGEVKTIKDYPTLPGPDAPASGSMAPKGDTQFTKKQGAALAVQQGLQAVHEVPVVGGQAQDLGQVVAKARRTIGLYRIDQADLERMRQPHFGGAETPQEEMILAVKEYLNLELKLDKVSIERMKIENTFYLDNDKKECLFVTFQHRSSVSKIFEKTYIMRKESRIQNYIPREFRDRARAIAEIEYNIREVEKCKTKVKMGLKDLQLFKKERGGKWEHVALPEDELPPVDLDPGNSPSKQGSSSPAPGRPCQSRTDKRSRESSGSPQGSQPKSARQENDTTDDDVGSDWSKVVEEADLVTDGSKISPARPGLVKQPDIGRIWSVSGTPSKTTPSPCTSLMNSPVFSRQNKS